jgi:tetratricopeptide (TPR) repeat protein
VAQPDDPDVPFYHAILGRFLERRFDLTRLVQDLDDAVLSMETSISFMASDHPDLPGLRNNLGYCLHSRFRHFGGEGDLDRALTQLQLAVELTPEEHPDMPSRLSNLGTSYRSRFEHYGDDKDLEQALLRHQLAVEFRLEHCTDLPPLLDNYAVSLQTRFQRYGDLLDLERAMSCQQWAVELTPSDHPGFFALVNNLGNLFRTRFDVLGDLDDLDCAISKQSLAFELTPEEDPDRASRLANLGTSLSARFARLGDMDDLGLAISHQKTAIELMPTGYPARVACLSNLAASIQARHDRLGETKDIDDAISFNWQALESFAENHPLHAPLLSNVGNSLISRFKRFGDLADLDKGITAQQQAVHLTPNGHPEYPSRLSNLGVSLVTRFLRSGHSEDIDLAIQSQKQSISTLPEHHISLSAHFNNLANSYRVRFERYQDGTDLAASISYQERALRLTPPDHPEFPSHLNNLANSLSSRFSEQGDVSDLDHAISVYQMAVQLIPSNHRATAALLNNLGGSLETRFLMTASNDSFQSAISAFRRSSEILAGDIHWRFQSAVRWAQLAHAHNNLLSALEAYRVATSLLPLFAWRGLNIQTRQYRIASSVTKLAVDAAACAITLCDLETAVELLDQGRSVLWTQAFELRTDLDDLRSIDPALANELDEVAHKLRQRAYDAMATDAASTSEQYRSLTDQWDRLVLQVRHLPQFEHFLRPMPYSRLRLASIGGPVILVNISEHRCDALIVTPDNPIQCVPLRDISRSEVGSLAADFQTYSQGRNIPYFEKHYLIPILRKLWSAIVLPVLDGLNSLHLAKTAASPKQRIWWCVTGPLTFLPIHAAGAYAQGSIDLADRVVSSYTISLAALVRDRGRPQPLCHKIVAIGETMTPNQAPLPGAHCEINLISKKASLVGLPFLSAEGSDATCERVLELLRDASCAHFACHGHQDSFEPLDSALYLHDGPLPISQIASRRLPHADFAFLSACHGASGDRGVPDESWHIAAAMQISGFRSIIASLSATSDDIAPLIAEQVYNHLFRAPTAAIVSSDAAAALDVAVQFLRRKKISLSQWVSFLHIGI